MNCSIVIRAYNEGRHLGRLLDGIRQQTVQDVEIILVDSGSSDETVSIAEAHGAKIIHIHPQDFTFGRSLNLGMEAVTHELVVIASAHVYPVYPDWLERLLEPFAGSATALTYGKQRGSPTGELGLGSTTKFSEHEIFARWYPEQPSLKQDHPFCNNANAAIRKRLWVEHPYDETLTGLEDLAWAKWALEQGYNLAYIPTAEIIHVHDETPKGVFNRYKREAMAFKRIYPEAHFSLYDFLRMTGSNIANDLWHASRQGLLLPSFTSIIWFRWNQFWGTYQGYRQSLEWNWQLRQTFYYPRGTQTIETSKREIEPIRYNK
ncbi:MAG TPA: glycosyltransferase family 2 protein [Anaerolineales bacterium]|jgi:glycosyltransferase involved in cell wall biosynthesis